MGEWDNTAFVATADTEAVAEALAKLVEASGRSLVDRPRSRKPVFPDPMQYGTGATSSRWAAAVLAGKKWTIIKTAPFELLCEGVDGRPRLAHLAEELGCDAFQLNIYDGDSHILLEADAEGAFRFAGFNASTGASTHHGFPLEDNVAFKLIRAPKPLVAAIGLGVVESSVRLRELLHGDPEACSNTVQVEYLIPHEPLANAVELHASRTPARPLREPLEVPLVVERTATETRYRLQLPAGEVWLDVGAGMVLTPRASAEAPAIVTALARWLDVTLDVPGGRVPSSVNVFGDLDDGELSISGVDGGALPITLDLDEPRGRATLREADANVASDLVAALAGAWTGTRDDVMVPHVELVPIPPHRTVEAVLAGDCIVIACDHDRRTSLWTWRPGEAATQIADLEGRFEQLARGPKRHEVTLRVGHGQHGHGPEDERDVFIFDTDGTRRTLFERTARIDRLAWSSDGKKLAVQINGTRARPHLQLYDANGAPLARSPDTMPLYHPRWVGPLVFCHRYDRTNVRYATWRPSDNAVEISHDWIDRSPSGLMMRGDREATHIGDHRLDGIVRPGSWTDPLVWLDGDTCVLARALDDEGYGQGVAVDAANVRVRAVLAAKRVLPCAQLDDVIVANDRGWRLWWGRIVEN